MRLAVMQEGKGREGKEGENVCGFLPMALVSISTLLREVLPPSPLPQSPSNRGATTARANRKFTVCLVLGYYAKCSTYILV